MAPGDGGPTASMARTVDKAISSVPGDDGSARRCPTGVDRLRGGQAAVREV